MDDTAPKSLARICTYLAVEMQREPEENGCEGEGCSACSTAWVLERSLVTLGKKVFEKPSKGRSTVQSLSARLIDPIRNHRHLHRTTYMLPIYLFIILSFPFHPQTLPYGVPLPRSLAVPFQAPLEEQARLLLFLLTEWL